MLKNTPSGKKGKGINMLPTAVRNKMGYRKMGGSIKGYGHGGSCSPRKEMAGAMEMPTRKK